MKVLRLLFHLVMWFWLVASLLLISKKKQDILFYVCESLFDWHTELSTDFDASTQFTVFELLVWYVKMTNRYIFLIPNYHNWKIWLIIINIINKYLKYNEVMYQLIQHRIALWVHQTVLSVHQ